MSRHSTALPWPLALAVAMSIGGCSRTGTPPPPPSPKPEAKDQTVLATVDGAPISRSEVDARAAGRLNQLRDQEYEARRDALEEIVLERILDQEARRRGVSRDELLRSEVEGKATKPTRAEIDQVYETNKSRMGGRSRDEMAPEIERSIVQQRSGERSREFKDQMRRKASVQITLGQPRVEVIVPTDAAILGPEKAPVTIVEFSDYLCPYCQKAEKMVVQVLDAYKGKVRFVHRDYLLGRPRSMAAARAGHCARDQGRFWEYRHDLLTQTGDFSDEDLLGRSRRLGLDPDAFKSCLASDRHDKDILASSEQGRALGVSATPTFFINGRRMEGIKSFDQFLALILSDLGAG